MTKYEVILWFVAHINNVMQMRKLVNYEDVYNRARVYKF
jgi:type IV secretory pathway TrbD component